jgi:catechol 2,3-dioxygenase-like lactoylglutathione lyase family enzyme
LAERLLCKQEVAGSNPAGSIAMTLNLFAGLRVSDFAAAKPWYERLLGAEPSFVPHAAEAVWELAEHRFLYIVEEGAAGGGALTLFVEDLDSRVAAIASRGIEPAERVTYSNGVRKVTYRDSDGNEVGFGGPPVADG